MILPGTTRRSEVLDEYEYLIEVFYEYLVQVRTL